MHKDVMPIKTPELGITNSVGNTLDVATAVAPRLNRKCSCPQLPPKKKWGHAFIMQCCIQRRP